MKRLITGLTEEWYLNTEDSKYDEERAADENDISYWTQRWQQSHHNQLQTRSSTDYSTREHSASMLHIESGLSLQKKLLNNLTP